MILFNSAPEDIFTSIYSVVIKDLVSYSHNENSMCIIKKFLIYRKNSQGKYKDIFLKLKTKLEEDTYDILNSHYGNYLFHTMIESWEDEELIPISHIVIPLSVELSKHIHASSTIERLISREGTGFNYLFLNKILKENFVEELIFDKHSKFVIKESVLSSMNSSDPNIKYLYKELMGEIKYSLKFNKHTTDQAKASLIDFWINFFREIKVNLKEIHAKKTSISGFKLLNISNYINSSSLYYDKSFKNAGLLQVPITSMQMYPSISYK